MANDPQFSDANTEASVNASTARLNAGFLVIYTGTQPAGADSGLTGTLLVTCDLDATAFAAATASGSAGTRVVTAAANTIADGIAVATGTAGYFALLQSDGTTVETMGSVGTSGADLNLSSTSIVSGGTVSISAGSIKQNEY